MTEKHKKQGQQEPVAKRSVRPKSKPSGKSIEISSGLYIGPLSLRDKLILRAGLTYLIAGIRAKKEEIGKSRLRVDMGNDLIFAEVQEVDTLLQKLSNA